MPRTPVFAIALLVAAAAVWTSCSNQPEFDLIIRGGTVYDGTGETVGVRRADVGVSGDRIRAIGDLGGRTATDVLDAGGKVVAPGFIDAHSRSGVTLLADGSGDSHLRQGITSEILADNSPVFWSAPTADTSALQRYGVTLDWSGPGGYFTKLESRGTAINVGTMVPLSLAAAAPDRTAFLDAAMRDGAFGIVDDIGAGTPEAVAAATVVGRYDGLLMEHAGGAVAATDETLLAVGEQAHRILIAGLAHMPADHPAPEMIGRMIRVASRNVTAYGTVTPYAAVPGEPDTAIREALKYGGIIVGTDSAAVKDATAPPGTPPAAFGAFPRLLGPLVRDGHVMELREAVRRATSLPASVFQIRQRGIIRESYFADVVVFDPAAIADRATLEKPNQYPAGIEYVVVNGIVELTPRGLTGSRAGSRLLRQAIAR